MDIVSVLVSLISGGVGGNIAGALLKNLNLGPVGNTIAGILGGGAGSAILGAMMGKAAPMAAAAGILDIGSILGTVGSGGVGGAVLMIIVGLIKHAMNKSGT